MSKKKLTVEEQKEAVMFDNAIVLSDDTFTKMMDAAWERHDKKKDIDPPMVALHTLSSCVYTLGRLGWTKEELYKEVDDYLDMAVKHDKEDASENPQPPPGEEPLKD